MLQPVLPRKWILVMLEKGTGKKKCAIYLCALNGWYVSVVPFSASKTVFLSNQVLAQFDFNFLVNGDMREEIARKSSIVRVTISKKDYH